jgi:hypothetical protein
VPRLGSCLLGFQASRRIRPCVESANSRQWCSTRREVAIEWNKLIAKKIDPQEAAEAQMREARANAELAAREEARRRAGTFANAAEHYIERRVAKMKARRNVARVIRRDLIARWGKLPVADISKTDAIELLESIEAKQGPYAARLAFAHAHALFNWLLEREEPEAASVWPHCEPVHQHQPGQDRRSAGAASADINAGRDSAVGGYRGRAVSRRSVRAGNKNPARR